MYVYILASKRNGTLYIGVTNNLERRIAEHKAGLIPGFTQKYNVKMLVWCEEYRDTRQALEREKKLKNWHRAWKIALIEETNPEWRDLAADGS
jgi:putative endonuclease